MKNYFDTLKGYTVQIYTDSGEIYIGMVTRTYDDYMLEMVPCDVGKLIDSFTGDLDLKDLKSIVVTTHKRLKDIKTVLVLDKSGKEYFINTQKK